MVVFAAIPFLFAACVGGGGGKTPPTDVGQTNPAPEEERLLVFGDVQLAGPFKTDPTVSAWKRGELDVSDFAARIAEAVRDARPTQILQTGDFVDLNESAVLDLGPTTTTTATAPPLLEQGWKEWAPMLAALSKEPKVYPVVGNHERYGRLVVTGELAPDGEHVEVRSLKLAKRAKPTEVHAALLSHFPHLSAAAVEHHKKSGSYYVTFNRYCLLSLDGADFDDDSSLWDFAESKLTNCKSAKKLPIVGIHYPLFTGRAKSEDEGLELATHRERLIDLFARHRVALVFSGHEHFYLRYLDQGRAKAGFASPRSNPPIYVTVAAFTNPYGRKQDRLPLPIGEPEARYFEGTHYTVATFNNSDVVRVTTKGLDRESGEWRDVDAFTTTNE